MVKPEEILAYWLDEVGSEGWYRGGEALDAEVQERFGPTLDEANAGACGLWLTYPAGTLAYIILTDQFTRNMFRGEARAFASDCAARAASKIAISRDWDLRIDEPARQFFYMPLMHSENLIDQDRAVRLILTRMPETGDNNLIHAKVHREIIRRFGRFPYRNAALGRASTEAEQAFLDGEGYGGIMRELEAQAEPA